MEEELDQLPLVGQQLPEPLVVQRELVRRRVSSRRRASPSRTATRSMSMTLRFARSSSVAVASSRPTLPIRQMKPTSAGGSGGSGMSRRYCAWNCVLGSRPYLTYSDDTRTRATSGNAEADDAPGDDPDARPEARAVGLVGELLLLGEDCAPRRAPRRRRLGQRRGREQDAALHERVRRQRIDRHDHARVRRDGHVAPQRAVRPGAHLVAGDAVGEVDGDAHVPATRPPSRRRRTASTARRCRSSAWRRPAPT